ncbi:APC family permease [Arthrobacter sp. UM1]|uniref:APC family permease n=1 Tax=Arthrobacter sp. UM1 TaxID=2766776 RepID=UPI001CF674C3|nr:amino acid permease [Arthrobacter sp. UM1]MCB4208828.1 amino acid permease [Arthrobacter sp. UM1]
MKLMRTKSVEDSLANADEPGRRLKRSLNAWDLTIMGVAVAVGAGIFTVGARTAALTSGPAVTISFVLAAITCAFAIMCYAEFATAMPVAGSAYVFTYATVGEIFAWIIGWNLILELFTAAAVVAKFWGIYLSVVLKGFGLDVPPTFEMGPLEFTWGPFLIVALFTVLLVMGTKLSARVGNVFTIIKIAVVLFVIVVGLFYFKGSNLSPFVPPAQPPASADGAALQQPFVSFITGQAPATYGFAGIIAGAAIVFFAFIGFDVVATSAEEVKDPAKTLPRGIFGGLIVTTVLYLGVSFAVTGMVPYTEMAKQKEISLATAFSLVHADWAAQIIAIGSLVGLTTVIMVLLLGFARVVMAMSRDGLLPRSLSVTSETRATPARVQIICGVIVALVAGFTQVDRLEELINIGTLSAFIMVSLGVLILRRRRPDLKAAYRVPGGPVIPVVSALLCFYLMLNLKVESWVFFAGWLVIGFLIYFAYGMRNSVLAKGKEASGVRPSEGGAHSAARPEGL